MIRIKFCGITRLEDALAAAEAGVDALGFIFYTKSKRCITVRQAAAIIRQLPPYVSPTGVFVNESVDEINRISDLCGLDYIQLSGDELPDSIQYVNRKVIKAVRINTETDLKILADYDVSGYLLDTAVEGEYGGTGRTFDWQKAVEAKQYGPVILAGGLHAGNVQDAIAMVHPYGIDIASGVEQSPGIKDHQKIQTVIQICRSEAILS